MSILHSSKSIISTLKSNCYPINWPYIRPYLSRMALCCLVYVFLHHILIVSRINQSNYLIDELNGQDFIDRPSAGVQLFNLPDFQSVLFYILLYILFKSYPNPPIRPTENRPLLSCSFSAFSSFFYFQTLLHPAFTLCSFFLFLSSEGTDRGCVRAGKRVEEKTENKKQKYRIISIQILLLHFTLCYFRLDSECEAGGMGTPVVSERSKPAYLSRWKSTSLSFLFSPSVFLLDIQTCHLLPYSLLFFGFWAITPLFALVSLNEQE